MADKEWTPRRLQEHEAKRAVEELGHACARFLKELDRWGKYSERDHDEFMRWIAKAQHETALLAYEHDRREKWEKVR